MRRWKAKSVAERIKLRKGAKALQDHKPFKLRDRSASVAMDGWNMDSRIWDLRVEWPGGKVRRPVVTMIQDEASNYLLGYEVGESESGDGYRRVICGAVAKYGKGRIINIDWTAMARLARIDGNHKGATLGLPETWFFDHVLGHRMKVEFFPRGVVGYVHADKDHDPRAPLVASSQFEPMYGVGSLTEAVELAIHHPPPPPVLSRRSPLPQVAR